MSDYCNLLLQCCSQSRQVCLRHWLPSLARGALAASQLPIKSGARLLAKSQSHPSASEIQSNQRAISRAFSNCCQFLLRLRFLKIPLAQRLARWPAACCLLQAAASAWLALQAQALQLESAPLSSAGRALTPVDGEGGVILLAFLRLPPGKICLLGKASPAPSRQGAQPAISLWLSSTKLLQHFLCLALPTTFHWSTWRG